MVCLRLLDMQYIQCGNFNLTMPNSNWSDGNIRIEAGRTIVSCNHGIVAMVTSVNHKGACMTK